jgi:hypothetical protein
VKVFVNWLVKPIFAATYFGAALLLFLVWWPLGVAGLVLAALFYGAASASIDAEEPTIGRGPDLP